MMPIIYCTMLHHFKGEVQIYFTLHPLQRVVLPIAVATLMAKR